MSIERKLVFSKLFKKVELESEKIELSSDEVYKHIFNGVKSADNAGLKGSSSGLGKAFTFFNKAEIEAKSMIKQISKIDINLLDSKLGSFLNISLDIAVKNQSKIKEAQGLLNKSISIINSLQSKSKI